MLKFKHFFKYEAINIDLMSSNFDNILDKTVSCLLRLNSNNRNVTLRISYGDGKNETLQTDSSKLYRFKQ